ncbi:MAG: hypothetical protein LUF30_08985, partial [Lachnospiraceae bacterium]|nr:hypothetical protein [Lachnospiraceae bacterium]
MNAASMVENEGASGIGINWREDRRFAGRGDERKIKSDTEAAWMGPNGSPSGRTVKEELAKGGSAMSSERWDAWEDDGEPGQENWAYEEGDPPVIHRERKRRQKAE